MAVSIDELQLQTTDKPPAAPSGDAKGAAKRPSLDVKAEMENLRERELRLRAD
jgi:hypothetical protein